MSNIVTLVTFANTNVRPQDDALIYAAAVNDSGLFYGTEISIKNTNTFHFTAGHGIIAGRKFTVDDGDISVVLPVSGTLLGRIYMHLDLSNASMPCSIMIETGTSITPPQQDANVNIFNGIYEFDMAYFDVSATQISNLRVVTPYVDTDGILSTIAPIAVTPADRAWLAGAYFVYNGRLYVTTRAIAIGDNLVVGDNIIETTIEQMVQAVSGISPNPMKRFVASGGDQEIKLFATPPDDTVVDGQYLCYVAGYRVVRKQGSIPEHDNDGTIVIDVSGADMHMYDNNPYVDSGLVNGQEYFYRAFPYSTIGVVNTSLTGNVASATPAEYIMFGFHYSENDSNPASVTYPADCANAGYTPMTMNLSTGVPNYGDWLPDGAETSWLFPKSCMLKYDGTVDYYLDENDETQKAGGGASDVANSNYAGNAMMEWGQGGKKIYWKIVPDADGKGFTFYVANAQVDGDFDAWNHYNANGQLADHFYTPKYFGSHDGTRLRSISGAANYVNTTGTNEIAKAKANNPSGSAEMWNIENYCDRLLISMLLCMMGKSMNTQAVFGKGVCGTSAGVLANNTLNGKGLFCGYSSQLSDVKVFGMQGWWGNLWRRMNGLINANGTIKVKLTYGQQDGTTVDGYNVDGSGYIVNGTASGMSGESISHMDITSKGITPKNGQGSDQTYYCDAAWLEASRVGFPRTGATMNYGDSAGAFCVDLNILASSSGAETGSAVSCKPLS